jgi:drug/metabolite transporter (DMT)-like permease
MRGRDCGGLAELALVLVCRMQASCEASVPCGWLGSNEADFVLSLSCGQLNTSTESETMNIKWTVLAFVAGAALSWGVYVPLVHDATTKFGSNLRAFLMVGIAYFLVAVLIPSFFIFYQGDPTVKDISKVNWNSTSITFGILAGVAGAVGALCVIFAVKEAGPTAAFIVAPLVFAGAPIINTIASVTIFAHGKKFESLSPTFYVGLLIATAGMVMVMINKPNEIKDAGKPAAGTTAEATK